MSAELNAAHLEVERNVLAELSDGATAPSACRGSIRSRLTLMDWRGAGRPRDPFGKKYYRDCKWFWTETQRKFRVA
jgi:hypothetical protein